MWKEEMKLRKDMEEVSNTSMSKNFITVLIFINVFMFLSIVKINN